MERTISLNLKVSEDTIEALKDMLTRDENKELYRDFEEDFDELPDDFDEDEEFDPEMEPDGYVLLNPSEVDDIQTYTDYLKVVFRKIYETNTQMRNVLRRHRSWTEKSSDVLKLLSFEEAFMEPAEACVFSIADKCRPLIEEIRESK